MNYSDENSQAGRFSKCDADMTICAGEKLTQKEAEEQLANVTNLLVKLFEISNPPESID